MVEHRSNWPTVVILFLLAFAARVLTLGDALTVDEAYHWFDRTHAFLSALEHGDLAGTNLIGHPGVTTMWLGALGLLLERAAVGMGWLPPDLYLVSMTFMRLPVAAATALCVGLAYPLLLRLFDARVALLSGLLWAGEPFLVAFSQLLHLDALLASFMTLSLLAMMTVVITTFQGVSPHRGDGAGGGAGVVGRPTRAGGGAGVVGRRTGASLLVFSGVFGGLALLTKSPSLALLPMLGVGMLVIARGSGGERGLRPAGLRLFGILIWLVVAVLVWVVCWPAAWADPLRLAGEVIYQARSDGGSPHGWGNFFLGRAVADPGPLFYPVALALRLTPWTLAGFLLAGLMAGRLLLRGQRRELLAPALLVLFVLLFLTMMSVPPKKFDRYALPVVPSLIILAAWGWVQVAAGAVARASSVGSQGVSQEPGTAHRPLHGVLAAVLALGLAAQLAWYAPYPLAYYNPLLGGGAAAVRLIPVGWGEGHEQAAAVINAQFNGADRPTATWYEPVLSPFVRGGTAPMDFAFQPNSVNYAVLYVDQIQRGYKPWLITPLQERRPLATIRIHDIAYAFVYAIGPPTDHALDAAFGPAITLRGYSLDSTAIRASNLLTVTLAWEALETPERDYAMFIHVLDERGRKVGQVDVPPGDPRAPTGSWTPGMLVGAVQQVPLQADLPPGRYALLIGLYDPQSFVRLPVQSAPRPPAPDDGGNTLLLEWFELPSP